MSSTRRNHGSHSEALRSTTPHGRERRRKMLNDFEREYIGNNKNPIIEL